MSVLLIQQLLFFAKLHVSVVSNGDRCHHAAERYGTDNPVLSFVAAINFMSIALTPVPAAAPASDVAVTETASPAGAATTASVASVVPSAVAVSVTPRRFRKVRSLSNARLTRF